MPVSRRSVVTLFLAVLVTATAAADQPTKRPMTVEDMWQVQRVGAPSISPDGKWAVVEVTTYHMDDNDSAADLWLLSTDGQTQKRLTAHKAKDAGPRWSPDGKQIAFLSKRDGDEAQIHLIAPDGGEARQLSKMPMSPSGLKWSADGKTIYCIGWTWPDTPDDDSFKKKQKALKDSKVKAYIIDDAMYRYWDKWIADGRRPVVFAIDVATGQHRNLFTNTKLHLPPYEPSAADYDVSPDGKEVCFVADSTKDIGTDFNTDLYVLSTEQPGEPRNLTADNPAGDGSPVYSPDGKQIAFTRQTVKFFYADRSRLMLHDRSSGKNEELTKLLDRSCGVPIWTPDGQMIYFIAEDKGYTRAVSVGTFGKVYGMVWPLTAGYSDRSLDFSHDRKQVVFIRSDFGLPPAVFTSSVRVDVGSDRWEPRKIDRFNDELTAKWQLGEVKEVWFKGADDREVQMWVVYPPGFDPKKKWPLLQIVHGGPHNGITTDYHFRWNLHLFASKGYVVACVNFHGSSGFGQEFTDSITGDLGTKPMTDIMKATDHMEAQPYIDKDRTTAAGASYGGFMMAWLNGHTDRFKAMVCHAGVYIHHSLNGQLETRDAGAAPAA